MSSLLSLIIVTLDLQITHRYTVSMNIFWSFEVVRWDCLIQEVSVYMWDYVFTSTGVEKIMNLLISVLRKFIWWYTLGDEG